MQSERDGLHVAIIMDGNGRWAKQRGLPRAAGHRAGIGAIRRVVECAPELGIRWLTLYAFSAENWRRPMAEVENIFWLLRAYLRLEQERLRQHGARLEVIGRRDRLPRTVVRSIEEAEGVTGAGRRLHLRIAFDYSSREAITRAATGTPLPGQRGSTGLAAPAELLRDAVGRELTGTSGDVDLLIRTGGEQRLSDFLLWESAFAELYFTDRMWPEFHAEDLAAAVTEFSRRERRFGSVPEHAQ